MCGSPRVDVVFHDEYDIHNEKDVMAKPKIVICMGSSCFARKCEMGYYGACPRSLLLLSMHTFTVPGLFPD